LLGADARAKTVDKRSVKGTRRTREAIERRRTETNDGSRRKKKNKKKGGRVYIAMGDALER